MQLRFKKKETRTNGWDFAWTYRPTEKSERGSEPDNYINKSLASFLSRFIGCRVRPVYN